MGMIPPRIRVNAGLHIAEGHNQQNNPSQPCEEAKMTRDNPKQTMTTAQAPKETQSFSWPYRGQNNSAATQNQGTPAATNTQWMIAAIHSPKKGKLSQ